MLEGMDVCCVCVEGGLCVCEHGMRSTEIFGYNDFIGIRERYQYIQYEV